MAKSIGVVATLFAMTATMLAPAARAQKSLSDGVDELAAKLAKTYGEGKKGKVAIVPLRELAGDENLLGAYIAETLTNSFFEAGYRDIVERPMLDRAIKELRLTLTGMIDSESAKKIGKFLQADLVVGGTLTELGGEVSVICRMFSVQTGEVVAVATSKIVKDDNVKTMLSRKLGPSGGVAPTSPVSESPTSQPVAAVQQSEGISFRLRNCVQKGQLIDCELGLVAEEGDSPVQIGWGSRLIDQSGHEAGAVSIFGSTTKAWHTQVNLVRGVQRTGRVRFEGVSEGSRTVPLIEIQFWKDGQGGSPRVAQFRDVKVK